MARVGREVTYEFLILATVLNLNVRLATLVEDLEGEVLDIGLDFCIGEFATNETLGIEHAEDDDQHDDRLMTKEAGHSRVVRVHRDLVLCGIADETFGVRERYVGGCCPVTLVVGDNLDTIVLPDTDTTVCGCD